MRLLENIMRNVNETLIIKNILTYTMLHTYFDDLIYTGKIIKLYKKTIKNNFN